MDVYSVLPSVNLNHPPPMLPYILRLRFRLKKKTRGNSLIQLGQDAPVRVCAEQLKRAVEPRGTTVFWGSLSKKSEVGGESGRLPTNKQKRRKGYT
jgi:hypothetical protein